MYILVVGLCSQLGSSRRQMVIDELANVAVVCKNLEGNWFHLFQKRVARCVFLCFRYIHVYRTIRIACVIGSTHFVHGK
jgi:hypothetical protein